MERKELEEKYDNFINSNSYRRLELYASKKYIKKNADLSRLSIMADNIVGNTLFLKTYFELARPNDENSQSAKNYVISVNGSEVVLNVNEAPDFIDKKNYLDWFESKVNKN